MLYADAIHCAEWTYANNWCLTVNGWCQSYLFDSSGGPPPFPQQHLPDSNNREYRSFFKLNNGIYEIFCA